MGSTTREAGTAASALGTYLTTVLPRVRSELRRIGPLPEGKAMNAEAVAVFATLAPRSNRANVVRAIVALQVAIDLRDAIEEGSDWERPDDSGLLEQLEASWRHEVAALPSYPAIAPLLGRAVERCEQGQIHTHLAAEDGPGSLESWAWELPSPPDYRWWELAAGASSSVAAHALIAAAANPGTSAETAELIDAAYHPPIGALTVFLDDLVDREADLVNSEHNYLAYYTGPDEAAERLALIASRAEASIGRLPHSGRHRAILAGVAGFYLSAGGAGTPYAQPIRQQLLKTLSPGARFLAGFMRARRLGERK